jgi:hypothetical protein
MENTAPPGSGDKRTQKKRQTRNLAGLVVEKEQSSCLFEGAGSVFRLLASSTSTPGILSFSSKSGIIPAALPLTQWFRFVEPNVQCIHLGGVVESYRLDVTFLELIPGQAAVPFTFHA